MDRESQGQIFQHHTSWVMNYCSECPLKEQSFVPPETNCACPDDVDLLVLAEAPAEQERQQGRPLVGSAGKIFRPVFASSGLNQVPYCVANVVMCTNIQNGKTVTPPKDAQVICQQYWKQLVVDLQPKVILLLGGTPADAFGIGRAKMGQKRQANPYGYAEKLAGSLKPKVLVTWHPSYVRRCDNMKKPEIRSGFESDFLLAKKLLGDLE